MRTFPEKRPSHRNPDSTKQCGPAGSCPIGRWAGEFNMPTRRREASVDLEMEWGSSSTEMEDVPAKRSRQSIAWTCFHCAESHGAHRRFTVVTLAAHGAAPQQLAMCLSCKWAAPELWIQGQQRPMDPTLAEAMTAALQTCVPALRPRDPSCLSGSLEAAEVTEEQDAQLEQRATEELQRLKLNPRRPQSGLSRGF